MTQIVNHTTGEKCELEFKPRGWTAKYNNTIHGVVKDSKGVEKYHITGKYTESLKMKCLDTEETTVLWEAPKVLDNADLMYGFNSYTLQLNLMTEQLKEKLPPTDSRFRPDLRLWEEGKQEESSNEKNRLEQLQRDRKKKLKETLGEAIEPENDPSYYTPKYFKSVTHPITGDPIYEYCTKNAYNSNYWEDREKCAFQHLPNIYSDNCMPFYK